MKFQTRDFSPSSWKKWALMVPSSTSVKIFKLIDDVIKLKNDTLSLRKTRRDQNRSFEISKTKSTHFLKFYD